MADVQPTTVAMDGLKIVEAKSAMKELKGVSIFVFASSFCFMHLSREQLFLYSI